MLQPITPNMGLIWVTIAPILLNVYNDNVPQVMTTNTVDTTIINQLNKQCVSIPWIRYASLGLVEQVMTQFNLSKTDHS